MLAAEALGAANVLAIKMPYRTSSAESLAHADLVVARTGIESLAGRDHAADRRLLRALPRCRQHAPRQQDGARAHDDPLRPLGALEGAGARHQQQDRAAARLRHAVRRHGLGAQSRSATCTRRRCGRWRRTSACPTRSCASSRRPICGRGRPTRQELGFGYREVDELLYLMVDLRYSRAELHAAGFCRGLRAPRRRHGAQLAVQAAPAGDRQGLEPHHRSRLPLRPRLGQVRLGSADCGMRIAAVRAARRYEGSADPSVDSAVRNPQSALG